MGVPRGGSSEHRQHSWTVAPTGEAFPPLSQPHFSDRKTQAQTKDPSGNYGGPALHSPTPAPPSERWLQISAWGGTRWHRGSSVS